MNASVSGSGAKSSGTTVLLHDYLTQPGGAERVVGVLADHWPGAEIRTLLYEPEGTFPEFKRHRVKASVLQPLAGRVSHRALLPLLPLGVASLRVSDADLVVSSSSGWAHGVAVPEGVPHVCYCHNPARWLYDTDRYLDGRPWAAAAARPALGGLRRWDLRAARRPTLYVANSRNVRKRIRATYGRDSVVIHPPVDTARFTPSPLPGDGYLLVLSRLLGYKRVDLAIEAARAVGVRVVIAGDGPDRERLRGLAGDGVEFAGRVADDDLAGLYGGARAFFLGGEEDFGITPLEANAAGRPVVAYGSGGALETMVDDVTGCLFGEQTPAAATQALGRALERSWDPSELARNAARFGPERFVRELDAAIAGHVGGSGPRA